MACSSNKPLIGINGYCSAEYEDNNDSRGSGNKIPLLTVVAVLYIFPRKMYPSSELGQREPPDAATARRWQLYIKMCEGCLGARVKTPRGRCQLPLKRIYTSQHNFSPIEELPIQYDALDCVPE